MATTWTTIIYHQIKPGVDCSDGLAAAWVASKAHPNADLLGCSYQSGVPRFSPGHRVIIVDFWFPKSVLTAWVESGIDVLVLDHHDSPIDQITGWGDAITPVTKIDLSEWGSLKGFLDKNHSGATLAWEYFFPNQPMPVFLEFVRDRDLWRWEFPETPAIHEAMAILGRSFELYDRLAPMTRKELLDFLLPVGAQPAKEKQIVVEAIAERFTWEEIPTGHRVPVVKLRPEEDRMASEVCTVLYRRYPEALFTACQNSDGAWSLRSNQYGNNTNVRLIAEKLGGGGHRNAAGLKIK